MEPVAVVDDGINSRFFLKNPPQRSIEISQDLFISEYQPNNLPFLSHGTYCAAVIRKYEPQAPLVSVKITNGESKKASIDQLIKALEWCSNNGIRLVNLSMGTVDFRDFQRVSHVVTNLSNKGLIIVAAYNNYNIYTCPASLPCVFGVKSAKSGCLTGNQFVMDKTIVDDGSNMIACSCFELYGCSDNVIHTPCSNSFAAPVITAAIYNLLAKNSSLRFKEIKEILSNMALSKSLSRTAIHQITPHRTCSSPAIAVCNKGEGPSNLAFAIEKLLIDDGYNVFLFSDSEEIMAQKDLVIPLKYMYRAGEENISSEVLSIIDCVYQPDIFIVCLNDNQNKQLVNQMQFDIILHELKDTQYLERDKLNISSNEYFYLNNKANKFIQKSKAEKNAGKIFDSIEALYKEILDQFSIV